MIWYFCSNNLSRNIASTIISMHIARLCIRLILPQSTINLKLQMNQFSIINYPLSVLNRYLLKFVLKYPSIDNIKTLQYEIFMNYRQTNLSFQTKLFFIMFY